VWEGITPIIVDIDPDTLQIDVNRVENAIISKASGVLATHVYGAPCYVEELTSLCKSNNIKLMYDAAHAFGTKISDKSLTSYGDLSALSFHATKVFHTIEGGGIVTNNKYGKGIKTLRNFGHESPSEFSIPGINAKMSEFHAAMGLSMLNHIDCLIEARKNISQRYDQNLPRVIKPKRLDCIYNYAYYPVILPSEEKLLKLTKKMNEASIFPRRYFYPSLSSLPYVKKVFKTPIADEISRCVLCLPLYPELSFCEVDMISDVVRGWL
jgi:dTDP-4-amino-4,6-dideoxygalactose transaminase